VPEQSRPDPERGEPHELPSGFMCPRCGGALWEVAAADQLGFQCRIGHAFSLRAMLAEHSAERRRAVSGARRQLAEAAALNRRIARWAREHGHNLAAAQLEAEATTLDKSSVDLLHLGTDAS
jgi:two-component system, chemotaxis family, protein-glutamate methylesterase/glutaminase